MRVWSRRRCGRFLAADCGRAVSLHRHGVCRSLGSSRDCLEQSLDGTKGERPQPNDRCHHRSVAAAPQVGNSKIFSEWGSVFHSLQANDNEARR